MGFLFLHLIYCYFEEGLVKKNPRLWELSLYLNIFFILFLTGITGFVIHRMGFEYIAWKLSPWKRGLVPSSTPRNRYLNKTSHFETLPDQKDEIIFLGDSLIEQARWDELFGIPHILNRGSGGDITGAMLWRLPEVTRRRPRKVFIMIGTNDLALLVKVSAILDNYEKMIQRIHTASPRTEIYIHSLLPVWGKWKGLRDNEHIREVNQKLLLLAKKHHCTYINLFSSFVDENGELRKDLSFDGLHLNGKGYLLWKEKIGSYVIDNQEE